MNTPDTLLNISASSDQVRRFIIEEHPVRGHWVQLDAPEAVNLLLDELLARG